MLKKPILQEAARGGADMEPIRISPSEVLKQVKAAKTLLVCAYPDEATCSKMKLPGAISRTELQALMPEVKKDQEIIFYCAWPNEVTSAGQALKYMMSGYMNVKIMDGGFEAWKNAGYEIVAE
jgi:rhodanese-related sulfurtransferase